MMTVEVRKQGFVNKMKQLETKVANSSRKVVRDLAQLGVFKAKSLAPMDTGKTANAIKAKPTRLSKNKVEWVITAPEAHSFPVVKVMHKNTSYAKQHWRKRSEEERKFMITTRKWLQERKDSVVKGGFRNIKI
jgi:hypothetical protein